MNDIKKIVKEWLELSWDYDLTYGITNNISSLLIKVWNESNINDRYEESQIFTFYNFDETLSSVYTLRDIFLKAVASADNIDLDYDYLIINNEGYFESFRKLSDYIELDRLDDFVSYLEKNYNANKEYLQEVHEEYIDHYGEEE